VAFSTEGWLIFAAYGQRIKVAAGLCSFSRPPIIGVSANAEFTGMK
jgi:hypothetical protein